MLSIVTCEMCVVLHKKGQVSMLGDEVDSF
jgi:hypothetical protein